MLKEPLDHIVRTALPWRDGPSRTECGHEVTATTPIITRDDFNARLESQGTKRAALTTCMTCYETAQRWARWADDPRSALGREIAWEGTYARNGRGHLLRDELRALARLAAIHREEFERLLDEEQSREAWLERKQAKAGRR